MRHINFFLGAQNGVFGGGGGKKVYVEKVCALFGPLFLTLRSLSETARWTHTINKLPGGPRIGLRFSPLSVGFP